MLNYAVRKGGINVDPVAFHILGKPVYWYGIIIALGVLIGIYLAMRHANKLGYDQEMIIDFCLLLKHSQHHITKHCNQTSQA